MTTVTLLSKPGCHLCDVAKPIVAGVVAQLADVTLVERSILDDAQLEQRWRNDIPVVLIDGEPHARWRVDADALESAIVTAQTPASTPSAPGVN